MNSIQTFIKINAPVSLVWNTLVDFPCYPTWNPFLQNMEGIVQEGAVLKVKMQFGKITKVIRPTITSIYENRYMEWELGFWHAFTGQHFFKMEELIKKFCKFIHGENFSGIFYRPVLWVIKQELEKRFVEMNEALKERLEMRNSLG